MITTTLNRIRELSPCEDEWTNLLAGLGKTSADDEPLSFATILKINGLDDALWYCRAEPRYAKEWRLLMVAYARRIEHLCTDPAVKNAIDVAERYSNGKATGEELNAASAAAWDAAWDTARTAAIRNAARAARATASAAAWNAAWDAAMTAAWDAARAAAWATRTAASVAAWDAAWDAEREWQTQEFLRVVTGTGASDG